MPPTRGEKRRYLQHLQTPPPPKMSQSNVSFGVSEPYGDQSNPRPIKASAAVRECLNLVASCVGETIRSNARFSVATETLPTGPYGQEALFTLDTSQRNASGHTVGDVVRAAKIVENTIWDTEEGRLRFKKGLTRVMHANQRRIGGTNIRIENRSFEATGGTTQNDPGGSQRPDSEQGTDDEEDPRIQRIQHEGSQNGDRSGGSSNTPSTIPSSSSTI